jgi:hypothetical protein
MASTQGVSKKPNQKQAAHNWGFKGRGPLLWACIGAGVFLVAIIGFAITWAIIVSVQSSDGVPIQLGEQLEKEKKKLPDIKDPWLETFKKQTEGFLRILEMHPYASRSSIDTDGDSSFPPSLLMAYSKSARDAEIVNYTVKVLEINNWEPIKNASFKKDVGDARKNALRRGLVDEYEAIAKQLADTVDDLQDRVNSPSGRSGWFSRTVTGGIDTYRGRHYGGGRLYSDAEIIARLNKVIEDNKPVIEFLNDIFLPALKEKYD